MDNVDYDGSHLRCEISANEVKEMADGVTRPYRKPSLEAPKNSSKALCGFRF
jgi:hypothetical protein